MPRIPKKEGTRYTRTADDQVMTGALKKGKSAEVIAYYNNLGNQYLWGRMTLTELNTSAKTHRPLINQVPDKEERKQFLQVFTARIQELKAEEGFRSK
jgi:hypothetical protein